jgi:Secretion system C-terminal sorting domain
MKKLYTVFFALAILLIANFPVQVSAQCTCSGGLPATAVYYAASLDTTNVSSSTISFPKFDPSIGTLSCVNFQDTLSGITTTNAWNKASTPYTYTFILTLINSITGPGFSISDYSPIIYGPSTLSPQGSPGDSIQYGPNKIFNSLTNDSSTGNTAGFLGTTGTADFTYTLGGTFGTVAGTNYGDQIVTNYWGSFGLTYYWCPSLPLANNLTNFTAFKNGKNVQLQWQALNEQSNVNYEIQSSKDGSNYQSAGSMPSNFSDGDSISSYQFMYPLSNTDAGILYFRIKRIDGAGKASYSIVKTINLGASGMISYQVYPNPVTNTVMLEFNEAQTGNFIVSLVNTIGQPVQQKAVTLSGTNQIRLDLNNQPPAGLYYLHAKDQTHNLQYVTKVLIK